MLMMKGTLWFGSEVSLRARCLLFSAPPFAIGRCWNLLGDEV